ncbi:lipoyl synthase [Candidatus Latescibacterota bacterium]
MTHIPSPSHAEDPDKKPLWLKRKIAHGAAYWDVAAVIRAGGLRTVCEEAQCPNRGECYSRGTATFLILGGRCTRACRFCAISHGAPEPPQPDEPARVAAAVQALGLSHVVVTSVTRDDLPDGGAGQFANTIRAVREACPGTVVEGLIPDFGGDLDALRLVLDAAPSVVAHNIETVPRLYARIRPGAVYTRSLDIIRKVRHHTPRFLTKTGIMLGLGETYPELIAMFADLRACGCDLLTLGQYLRPDTACEPVTRFVPPDEFAHLKEIACGMGFSHVEAGPFVRSSFRAGEAFRAVTSGQHSLPA